MGCQKSSPIDDAELVSLWTEMTLHITKHTPANTPTYASRGFGYIGLCMYEASVTDSIGESLSLRSSLQGLTDMPSMSSVINPRISINAAQSFMLKHIYPQTSASNMLRIDSLHQAIEERIVTHADADKAVIDMSTKYGRAVAEGIYRWSMQDGGHKAYLKNFDKKMVHPSTPGSWKPPLYGQSFSHFPLHPHWGKNRTIVSQNQNIDDPIIIPFDTSKRSKYYQQFIEVYNQEKALTQGQKEIAVWWGDDPDETFTPPGHSYYIASLAIKSKPTLTLHQRTRVMASVGMAVADAFTNCWRWKYQYFTERPNTFITEHIDPRWESFWPDPPFPALPSGHAIQAAAAGTVLIHLLGDTISITDNAHLGRKKDGLRNTEFKPRTYHSFTQIMREVADSRFYGGIHKREDNEIGLTKGTLIGQNINNLPWKK
jgi:hypothetical protein